MNAILHVPRPGNEPVMEYGPGSPEREALCSTLSSLRSAEVDIPLLIGGREIRTGKLGECRIPHDHRHRLGVFHKAGAVPTSSAYFSAASINRSLRCRGPSSRCPTALRFFLNIKQHLCLLQTTPELLVLLLQLLHSNLIPRLLPLGLLLRQHRTVPLPTPGGKM